MEFVQEKLQTKIRDSHNKCNLVTGLRKGRIGMGKEMESRLVKTRLALHLS